MRRLLILGAWAVYAPAMVAAEATPGVVPPAIASETQQLDEIVVRGTRLYELRAAIVEAEDRFYAVYNDLNKIDEFDIKCSMSKPPGTLLAYRYCRARLVDTAESDEARDFHERLNSGNSAAIPRGMDAPTVLIARSAQFEQHLLTLINTEPELRELVRKREEAQQRYDRERVKRMKGRLVLFE